MSHATGWRQQERELRVCDFRLRGAALKFFSPFVCARTQMRSATTVHTKHMIQACTMDKEHNSSTSFIVHFLYLFFIFYTTRREMQLKSDLTSRMHYVVV
jgi:hypothetical protein